MLRDIAITILFLFCIFFDEIFNCSLIITGTVVDTGIKQYEAIVFAGGVYILMLFDIIRKRFLGIDFRIFLLMSIVLLLYYMTQFFYSPLIQGYTSYLLVFGSECIPAAYLGSKVLEIRKHGEIDYYLVFFVIPISFVIGTVGLYYASMNELVKNDDSGLNYQTMSYFMAYSYSYCCYLLFFSNEFKDNSKIIKKIAIIATALMSIAICAVSGGRGALYFLVLFTLFLLYIGIKIKKISKERALFLLITIIVLSLSILTYFDFWNSAGLERVMSRLTEHETRNELYGYAYSSFLDSPLIGNGLGSVWWTVGYYSHNIFLDFLTEAGLLGLLLFVIISGKALYIIYRSSTDSLSPLSYFILFVYIGILFHDLFSGYWIGSMHLFLAYGYAFSLSYRQNKYKRKFVKSK